MAIEYSPEKQKEFEEFIKQVTKNYRISTFEF